MTVLSFPDVRAEGDPASPNAQVPAPTRVRAREDSEPAPERRSFTLHVPRVPSARLVSGVLQGGSLLATAAPAVLAVWAGHQQAAGYYRHWFVKYPRLAYGAGHAFIEVPALYLLAWCGRSLLLRLVIYASLVIMIHLTGHHIVWRYL